MFLNCFPAWKQHGSLPLTFLWWELIICSQKYERRYSHGWRTNSQWQCHVMKGKAWVMGRQLPQHPVQAEARTAGSLTELVSIRHGKKTTRLSRMLELAVATNRNSNQPKKKGHLLALITGKFKGLRWLNIQLNPDTQRWMLGPSFSFHFHILTKALLFFYRSFSALQGQWPTAGLISHLLNSML